MFGPLVRELSDEDLVDRYDEAELRIRELMATCHRRNGWTGAELREWALIDALEEEKRRRDGFASTEDPAGMKDAALLGELLDLTERLSNDNDTWVDHASCNARVDVLKAEVLRRMEGGLP